LEKKIKLLERENLISKYQAETLKSVKDNYDSMKNSRIWRLREALLGKDKQLTDRFSEVMQITPIISSLYSKSESLIKNARKLEVINIRHTGPIISVIVPFYNYMEYIDECINSIH